MLDPMKLGRKHPCAEKNKKRLIAFNESITWPNGEGGGGHKSGQ
jgi:hypothetical protein